AQSKALQAINGGLLEDFTDIAYLKFSSTATNPRAPYTEYQATQDPDNAQGGKVASTFVDQLKNTREPRLYVLLVVWT
ncbi:MAG: SusD/RagB family nutrient-binding outer membrane lipoprotein, partial [Bacteroidales bacterium]|nr:SusD/RagB family nutrient-binding outer membrane lipoprotein [Bacteroidales bacterium]